MFLNPRARVLTFWMLAGSNFVFWLCISILFEVVYFESAIDNICVLVLVIILSLVVFFSIVVSLICIISFIREDEFALHGHHVIFHDGQKSKLKIINEHGLSLFGVGEWVGGVVVLVG